MFVRWVKIILYYNIFLLFFWSFGIVVVVFIGILIWYGGEVYGWNLREYVKEIKLNKWIMNKRKKRRKRRKGKKKKEKERKEKERKRRERKDRKRKIERNK